MAPARGARRWRYTRAVGRDLEHALVLWLFPGLVFLWIVWRIVRVSRRLRRAREAREAMSPEEIAADLERRRRQAPRTALYVALILAALIAYEYWLGDLGWWLGRL